jgi:hypothetical protein
VSRKKQVSSRERALWAALVLAENHEESLLRRKNTPADEAKHAMYVTLLTRKRLRDEFNLNLDTIFSDADEVYFEMQDQAKRQVDEDNERERRLDETLDMIGKKMKELLEKKP